MKMYNDKYNPPDNYTDLDGNTKTFTYIDYSKKSKMFIPSSSKFNDQVEYLKGLININFTIDEISTYIKDCDKELFEDLTYGEYLLLCKKINDKNIQKIICQL